MTANVILEKVPPGGSEWASSFVVVRKPNCDVRIWADYKMGVNLCRLLPSAECRIRTYDTRWHVILRKAGLGQRLQPDSSGPNVERNSHHQHTNWTTAMDSSAIRRENSQRNISISNESHFGEQMRKYCHLPRRHLHRSNSEEEMEQKISKITSSPFCKTQGKN